MATYVLQWTMCSWLLRTSDPSIPNGPILCKDYPRQILGLKFQAQENPLFRFPEFALGSMITHAIVILNGATTEGQSVLTEKQQKFLAIATDAVPVLLLSFLALSRTHLGNSADASDCASLWYMIAGMNLLSPIWCFWLFGMAFGSVASWSRKILSSRYALAMGQASFGIFLYQFLGLEHARHLGVDCILGAYLVSLSAALCSFFVVEEPVRQFVKQQLH